MLHQSSHSGLPESRDDQQVSVGVAEYSPERHGGFAQSLGVRAEGSLGMRTNAVARAAAVARRRSRARRWSRSRCGRSSRSSSGDTASIESARRPRRADRGRRRAVARLRRRDLARAVVGPLRGHRHAGADPRGRARRGDRSLRAPVDGARPRRSRRSWRSCCSCVARRAMPGRDAAGRGIRLIARRADARARYASSTSSSVRRRRDVPGRPHVVERVLDAALRVDHEGRADDAHDDLAVVQLVAPHAVLRVDPVVGIAQQVVGEPVLLAEAAELLGLVARDAEDRVARGLQRREAVAEVARLFRAARASSPRGRRTG